MFIIRLFLIYLLFRYAADRMFELKEMEIEQRRKENEVPIALPPTVESQALQNARQYKTELIQTWLYHLGDENVENSVTNWRFHEGECDIIDFSLLGDKTVYTGQLFFTASGRFPRVCKMEYERSGEVVVINEEESSPYTKEMFGAFEEAEMDEDSHRKYLTEIAKEVQASGQAEFSILEYEGITEDEFMASWSEEQVEALQEYVLLKNEQLEVLERASAYSFIVIPCTRPQLPE